MLSNHSSVSRGSALAIAALAAVTFVGLTGLITPARAAVIVGSVITPSSYINAINSSSTTINLSDGTAAWVYYGYNDTVSDITDPTNAANFALSGTALEAWNGGPAPYFTFVGASSGPSENIIFSPGSGTASSITFLFTSTVIAPSETVQVYLGSYDTKSNISVSLTSGTNNLGTFNTDIALPTGSWYGTKEGDGTGTNQGGGILSLGISGAAVGDLLSVTDVADFSGVSNTGNANISIQAADVVVPEPATLGLIVAGGLGLLLLKRSRA